MNSQRNNSDVIDYMIDDIKEIKKDVKMLLEVRNKQSGFNKALNIVITGMTTIIFNVIILIFKK